MSGRLRIKGAPKAVWVCVALVLGALAGLPAVAAVSTPFVLMGGGPEESTLMAQALSLAGGPHARVAIVPAASSHPSEAGSDYQRYFRTFGVLADVLDLPTRASAAAPATLRQEAAADLLFFTGGDQQKLADALAGTPLLGAIVDAWRRGAVVAGTSGGAMPWGPAYIANGTSAGALAVAFDRDAQGRAGLELRPGLRLRDDLVVDTHFDELTRLGRLLLADAATPKAAAIGVDERTAAFVTGSTIRALGAGAVTVIEASGLMGDNALTAGRSLPFAAGPFELERLGSGQSYTLSTAYPPASEPRAARIPTPAAGELFGWFGPPQATPIPRPTPTPTPAAPTPVQPITLIGAPMPPVESSALAAFVRDSGGTQARIVILAGDGAARDADAWRGGLLLAGAGSAFIQTATDLHDQSLAAALEHATGIFFLEDEAGTLLEALNANRRDLGNVVAVYAPRLPMAAAGLGVRILGDVAYFGMPGEPDRQVMPGLHFLEGIVADDAFWHLGGMERLIETTLMAGRATGLGLSPTSELRIESGQALASGTSQVVVIEAHGVRAFTLPATDSSVPASATGLEVSVLPPQGAYDLDRHLPRF